MIPNTTQLGRKLMTLTVLILLLATVIAQSSHQDISEVKPFAEYDLSLTKDHPMLRSRDMTYAHRNIVVTKNLWSQSGPTGFSIKLISPKPNSTSSECFQPFSPDSMHTVTRLSYKTILFESLPVNNQMKGKLILVNMKNCNYTTVYDGPLSRNYKIFTSDNASDDSFTLIMNGKKFCRGNNGCRLFFNPVYHKFEPLYFRSPDLHFPYSGFYNIKPVTSFDGNLFVEEFLDNVDNTYNIRLSNVTNNPASSEYKELLSLPKYVSLRFGWSQIKLISSPLSYCWRTNQDTDQDKIVHCSAFREDGTVVVNQTIVYSNVVKFYKVQSIPNGLILIGKRECSNDIKCSEVQSTMITNDSCINYYSDCNNSTPQGNELITVRHRYSNFKCRPSFVSQMHLRVNVSIDSVEVDHICIYMDRTDYEHSHSYVL